MEDLMHRIRGAIILEDAEASCIDDSNRIFRHAKELLYSYFKKEYESTSISKNDNITDMIDDESFILSFNYTDLINLYSINYNFAHGSISDDHEIVLGFSEVTPHPDFFDGNMLAYDKNSSPINKEELAKTQFKRRDMIIFLILYENISMEKNNIYDEIRLDVKALFHLHGSHIPPQN